MRLVAEYALASIVYHRRYLQQHLSPKHILFETTLFRNRDMLDKLEPMVACRLAREDDRIQPTGISLPSAQLKCLAQINEKVSEIIPTIQKSEQKVIEGVEKVLEDNSVQVGSVSRSCLREEIQAAFTNSGILDTIKRLECNQKNYQETLSITHHQVNQTYMWKGMFHRVPDTFQFPQGCILTSWKLYCCGDKSKNYPPLRYLEPSDMPTNNMRKRLSDFKFIMRQIETHIRQKQKWIEAPSELQANEMYEYGIKCLHLTNKRRRNNQIKWTSAVTILRQRKKQKK